MAYINRAEFSPAAGKSSELTVTLQEWVRENERVGVRPRISRRVLSPEGQVIAVIARHESLTSFEKAREALLASPSVRALVERVIAAVRVPFRNELFEILVARTDPSSPMPRYAHRALVFPRSESLAQVRDLLTALAKTRQDEGRSDFRLSQQAFPPNGPVLVLGDSYKSLGEVDAIRSKPPASLVNTLNKIAPLTRAPISQDLFESAS